MVAFCSTIQKSHWLPIFCWKSRLGVDPKVRISSIESQEQENKILCTANEEMEATTLTLKNSKSDKGQGDY